uniref:Kinesin motor domain-containing protein n=1 Tax=Alexandrium monilatum TaxID=311494 RepID=A0A7S4VHS4_9DINO
MAAPSGPEDERGRRRGQHFVSVAIRVRPLFGPEEPVAVWAKQPERREQGLKRVCCNRGYILEEYEFSRVFGPEEDNCELFRSLQGPAVTASVFSGVNETLFAYGQTGSGKTHTIFGTREESGLLQLFVRAIFDQAEVCPGSTVHACCYEVLGDSLTDLISPVALLDAGEVREEDIVYDEMFIKTQKCRYQIVRVNSVSTCLSLLQDARANRTAGVSSCNATSSRSHAIVHLFVQNPAAASAQGAGGRSGGISSSIGALTLVDLAGTEKEHENPSEQGRKSARLLNTSLSSLNRLLRRLQTGGLDESERRQSVLNKCLWEYLRPGCGISLIFCVNPLLRHRAITLSTLAMATDSKLIHSQRKAQYIQVPAPAPQEPRTVPQLPQFGSSSPSAGARPPRPGTPSQAGGQGEERTPRGCSTPNRTPSARGGAQRSRTPDFCMTPQVPPGAGAPGSRSSSVASRQRVGGAHPQHPEEEMTAEELEQLCGHDLRSPVAVRSLALQNTKLRRKLSRSRARSQERVTRAERERDALGLENTALQHECESLRALFIRQQQQQIAFWTGPFMEMIAPRETPASLAASLRSPASRSGADPEASPAGVSPSAASASSVTTGSMGRRSGGGTHGAASSTTSTLAAAAAARGLPEVEEVREECMRSLRRERDYWRLLATDLKRDAQGRPPTRGSRWHKSSRHEGSDLSTSQSQHEGSEPSRAVWSGSDSGSELSADSFPIDAER